MDLCKEEEGKRDRREKEGGGKDILRISYLCFMGIGVAEYYGAVDGHKGTCMLRLGHNLTVTYFSCIQCNTTCCHDAKLCS